MRLTRLTQRPLSVLTLPHRAPWMSAALAGALALVFLIDRASEAAPIQHLYYLPIVLAAAWFGTPGGLFVSFAAVVLYHVANPALVHGPYKDTDLVQIVLFFGVGLGAARIIGDARRLRRLAMTDDLTGLHNLRSFEALLLRAIIAAQASSQPLSLLVLDVDRLKQMNDTHGHLAGAEAVRTVGHLIAGQLPRHASGCRYGGDEFVVLLPGCDTAEAGRVAEDIRKAVNDAAPRLAAIEFPAGTLSVSVGVASARPGAPRTGPADPADAGEALFRAADKALYDAKASGRNRVTGAILRSTA